MACRDKNQLEILEHLIFKYEEELMDMNPQDSDFHYLQQEIIRLREMRDELLKKQK